jgi:hypothetical protein
VEAVSDDLEHERVHVGLVGNGQELRKEAGID